MINVGEAVSRPIYADHCSPCHVDMAAYDQLPTMIRRVIARMPANVEVPPGLEIYEIGEMTAIEIINALRLLEKEFLEAAYSDRGFFITHKHTQFNAPIIDSVRGGI